MENTREELSVIWFWVVKSKRKYDCADRIEIFQIRRYWKCAAIKKLITPYIWLSKQRIPIIYGYYVYTKLSISYVDTC